MIFCDTSTVAKLYVPERESQAVRIRLEEEDEVCVSKLVGVELTAVFHRRVREGKWSRREFIAATNQFLADSIGGFWTWLPLDEVVVDAAARTFATLPDHVFLRSSDCLHLVTAIHHNFTDVFTHDKHQADAAGVLGLRAVKIEP